MAGCVVIDWVPIGGGDRAGVRPPKPTAQITVRKEKISESLFLPICRTGFVARDAISC
jgi:hypothetical protein